MTGTDHEHSESIVLAAQWLAEQHPAPQPVIHELRKRFPLSALEACEACAMAQRFRTYRKAAG
ncbi:hypothetical protein [Rhizobium leguminosarum]|jgi:hypothetical protein